MLLLAGCAAQPVNMASLRGTRYDSRLGVSSSEKVVADGQPVPRGGGGYLTGRPYVIGGRSYVPQQNANGYVAVGTASWYGDAFHGRRTANGEVFDKASLSAAHPTLPLPSYVRVTNTGNGRSMVVRVNDRGPYHGGRVMDVSERVAETLDFKRAGTAHIKVEYIGRAGLGGSDDAKLMATLRTDGSPAQLAGFESERPSDLSASAVPMPAPVQSPPVPQPSRVARVNHDEARGDGLPDPTSPGPYGKNVDTPLPPGRPFDVDQAAESEDAVTRRLWHEPATDGRSG